MVMPTAMVMQKALLHDLSGCSAHFRTTTSNARESCSSHLIIAVLACSAILKRVIAGTGPHG